MRLMKSMVVIPALALLAMSCAPRHAGPHGPGGPPCKDRGMAKMMMHGCGPESCAYGSRCFSPGAIRSNDGACQECSGGKWVGASGCHEGCGMKHGKKSAPCEHKHEHHH